MEHVTKAVPQPKVSPCRWLWSFARTRRRRRAARRPPSQAALCGPGSPEAVLQGGNLKDWQFLGRPLFWAIFGAGFCPIELG